MTVPLDQAEAPDTELTTTVAALVDRSPQPEASNQQSSTDARSNSDSTPPESAAWNASNASLAPASATQSAARSPARFVTLVASMIVGLIIGRYAFPNETQPFITEQGRMLARGELTRALTEQADSAIDRETGIRVGVSYVAKSGDYCRTFTVSREHMLAGLACQRDMGWILDALTRTTANSTSAYRMAGVEVPALILSIVENTISGDPLDAEQVAEARAKGWRR